MVKNGQQSAIRMLRYQAGGEPDGVEVTTFTRLRTMPAGSRHPTVQRAQAVVDARMIDEQMPFSENEPGNEPSMAPRRIGLLR